MTAHAGCGSTFVFSSPVARRAVECGVHSSQGEAGKLQVIKSGVLPIVDRMALLTLSRKAGSNVVGNGGLLKGLLVARIALDRESLKLAHGFALVTVSAVQSCVATHQGEAVFVIFGSLGNDVPPFYGVTLFAVGTHLTAMDVGMTVSAVCPCIGEHRLGVTLRTRNALMEAAQGIASLIVIELRDRADGLPSNRGMAVLARDTQVAVWTAGDRTARLAVTQRDECTCRQP